MKPTRKEVLISLLRLDRPLDDIRRELASYSWDSDEPLVALGRDASRSILHRFLSGKLSASELEDWADAVEGREDITFEKGHEAVLKELIFELANPTLVGEINDSQVSRWLDRLEKSTL